MKQRQHGGPDAEGTVPYDFSTNANACGPCPQALEAVRRADATRYPDPGLTHLRTALADFHGVAVERIVPAASASEFIFRITAWAARRGVRDVSLPPHAYVDYAHAAAAWGMTVTATGSLVWACEPSSPLGQKERAVQGTIMVLDRAYEPLRLDGECSFGADALDRMWQLWSPNKALGLTGVRGAYAIAPAGCATDELELLAPSWLLGAHGLAMLLAWCEAPAQQWLLQSRTTLREWKLRQQVLCRQLGWALQQSDANFFVGSIPNLSAALPELRRRGVRLRDCASFGLPGQARLSVLRPPAQDALVAAWREIA